MKRRNGALGSLAVVTVASALLAGRAGGSVQAEDDRIPIRPNVVVVMVDDLDAGSTLTAVRSGLVPNLVRHVLDPGTAFTESFVTLSLCCPSRSTFLTGLYPHNHGVVRNSGVAGGFARFDDRSTVATWLRAAGYRTGHVGKYLNGYVDPAYVPPGWDDWHALVDVSTYCMYDYNQGGLSVIDFTDSTKPTEIAYFDRGPISDKAEVLGGYWSTYWYSGRIYGTEIARGLDVLELSPGTNLTANEIAAARLANQRRTFNPQDQYPVSWPDAPVVARAYLDQLLRDGSVGKDAAASLGAVLDKAQARLDAGMKDAGVAAELRSRAGRLAGAAAGTRQVKLARVIDAIAAKLS